MPGKSFNSLIFTSSLVAQWILLAGTGGITTLMRGTAGEIAAAVNGLRFVHDFLDEVVQVATTFGHPPAPSFLANAEAMLTVKGAPQTSSMFRDLQKGNPIEADHIIGDLLARGLQAGVRTPLLSAVYTHLSAYQHRSTA